MKLRALIPLLLLLTVSGCSFGSADNNHTAHAGHRDQTGLQMILFYDKTANNSAKGNYLDALLEVIDQYPQEHRHITVHSSDDHNLDKKYHLKRHPALVVINNGKTKVHIEGDNNKSAIVKEVTKVIKETKAN